MSLLPMFKRCPHCGHRYTYNPSVGDLGFNCPKCGGMAGIFGSDGRIGVPDDGGEGSQSLLSRIIEIFK